jgi:hypothetical protein
MALLFLSKKRKRMIIPLKEISPNKIAAVMSMPRLMFSDNMTCLNRAIVSKGISLTKQTGVYWGQCLTRLIELETKNDIEYLITVDYDSWFRYEDIVRLIGLLESNKEYDAVFPVQIKRDDGLLLIGMKPKEGQKDTVIEKQYLQDNDIIPVDSGHFGLTVFRKSCFAKLKKPWFMPKPDSNGDWGDDRIDEDVMFWHNFKDSGCNLGLATKVKIGHLQLMVTYPDTLENDWKPVHKSVSEMDKR